MMPRARMLELILIWQERNWSDDEWAEIGLGLPNWREQVAHPIHLLCPAAGIPWQFIQHPTPERALYISAAYAAALAKGE